MKGYWENNVQRMFCYAIDGTFFLQKGFPSLYSDYACDPNYLDIVEKVNLAAESLDCAFELYQTMIKGVR